MKKFIYIFSVLFIFSCEDEVDIDHPVGPTKVVVDGVFSTENKIQTILLSETLPSKSSVSNNGLSGATVSVIDNEGVEVSFTESELGVYQTNDSVSALVGNSYYTKIILQTGEVILSTPETVVAVPSIDSIYFLHVSEYNYVEGPPREIDEEETGYHVFIDMVETPGVGNAYQWKSYIDGEYLSDPEYLSIENDNSIFSNFFNEDGSEQDQFDFFYLAPQGSEVKVEMYSISQAQHKFLITLFTNTVDVGTPFSTPPASPKGNLYYEADPNGSTVLGYFSAVDVTSRTIVIDDNKDD